MHYNNTTSDMSNGFWNSYRTSILLLGGIVAGGLIGWLAPTFATAVLVPIGKIFMNVMFVIIVPMIFFSVSSSVSRMSRESRLGSTLLRFSCVSLTILVGLCTLTYFAILLFPPLTDGFESGGTAESVESSSIGDMIVSALTVSELRDLFSVKHILPMMLIAILTGIAAADMKNAKLIAGLELLSGLTAKMMDLLMVAAPLGLGCYFAGMTAQSGSMLLAGYGRVLLLYLTLTALVFVVLNPLIARLRGISLRSYFKHIAEPSLLSISTLSSSACIPANIKAARGMGCNPATAETIVPLSTQLYKQGSAISCVVKVMFAMMLSGIALDNAGSALIVIGLALAASVIVGAVPTGAGSAEAFICSVLGCDPHILGLLIVISALVDMPGTLLNVNGNTLMPLLVDRDKDKKAAK